MSRAKRSVVHRPTLVLVALSLGVSAGLLGVMPGGSSLTGQLQTGTCGDQQCGPGEQQSCSQDCPGPCGDGICNFREKNGCYTDYCWVGSCPRDCPTTGGSENTNCGNGVCDATESALAIPGHMGPPFFCPQDCPKGGGDAACGNNRCDPGEANVCPACRQATPACGAPCTLGTCPRDCPNNGGGGSGVPPPRPPAGCVVRLLSPVQANPIPQGGMSVPLAGCDDIAFLELDQPLLKQEGKSISYGGMSVTWHQGQLMIVAQGDGSSADLVIDGKSYELFGVGRNDPNVDGICLDEENCIAVRNRRACVGVRNDGTAGGIQFPVGSQAQQRVEQMCENRRPGAVRCCVPNKGSDQSGNPVGVCAPAPPDLGAYGDCEGGKILMGDLASQCDQYAARNCDMRANYFCKPNGPSNAINPVLNPKTRGFAWIPAVNSDIPDGAYDTVSTESSWPDEICGTWFCAFDPRVGDPFRKRCYNEPLGIPADWGSTWCGQKEDDQGNLPGGGYVWEGGGRYGPSLLPPFCGTVSKNDIAKIKSEARAKFPSDVAQQESFVGLQLFGRVDPDGSKYEKGSFDTLRECVVACNQKEQTEMIRQGPATVRPQQASNCAPLVCADGTQYPKCAEDGSVINYFADPCKKLR